MARYHAPSRASLVRLVGVGFFGLSLVLAGCVANPDSTSPNGSETTAGASEAGTDAASVVATAGEKTIAAGTARFRLDGSTKASGGSSGLQSASGSYTMAGSIDFENAKSELKVVPESAGEAGEVQIISIQDVQYVKLAATGSDGWIKKETRDPGTGDSVSVPLNLVNVLKNIEDVQEVGSDPVEGVPATKYTGTTDVRQALDGAGIPVGQADSGDLTGSAEISVWIDDQGRIVRAEHKTSAQVGRTEIDTEISIRIFDFGVSLDIQAPPTTK